MHQHGRAAPDCLPFINWATSPFNQPKAPEQRSPSGDAVGRRAVSGRKIFSSRTGMREAVGLSKGPRSNSVDPYTTFGSKIRSIPRLSGSHRSLEELLKQLVRLAHDTR